MFAMDSARKNKILSWMSRIESSPLTVKLFFAKHKVPFSLSRYFIYKRNIARYGSEGIKDRRSFGNNTKLTAEIKVFLQVIKKFLQKKNYQP